MKVTSAGIGLTAAMAVVISWSINKSVLWMFVHGMFGILYVIYYALGMAGTPK